MSGRSMGHTTISCTLCLAKSRPAISHHFTFGDRLSISFVMSSTSFGSMFFRRSSTSMSAPAPPCIPPDDPVPAPERSSLSSSRRKGGMKPRLFLPPRLFCPPVLALKSCGGGAKRLPRRACFEFKKMHKQLATIETSSCASFSEPEMNPAYGGGFLGKNKSNLQRGNQQKKRSRFGF